MDRRILNIGHPGEDFPREKHGMSHVGHTVSKLKIEG